jgi:hypothetical protein
MLFTQVGSKDCFKQNLEPLIQRPYNLTYQCIKKVGVFKALDLWALL